MTGGGTLLDALQHRLTTMEVSSSTDGRCPRVVLRGQRSAVRGQDPTVYVDGTRMAGTCVLTQLSSNEVDSVVVYHAGTSPRISTPSSGFGLILVYRARR